LISEPASWPVILFYLLYLRPAAHPSATQFASPADRIPLFPYANAQANLFPLQPDHGHNVAMHPEMLAREVTLLATPLNRGIRTAAFQKSGHRNVQMLAGVAVDMV
jgi:hypothetical protein